MLSQGGYMAQFYPKHKFLDSKLEAQYGEDVFASGWKKNYRRGLEGCR